MKILKKSSESVKREEAHAGSGARKLYLTSGELKNPSFQAMTFGYLPSKSKFSWHLHDGVEEVMLVIRGKGIVRDRDGEYDYSEGDLFVFPPNVEHEIENPSGIEHHYIFFRMSSSLDKP